jgi:hypothetical protein
MVVLSLFGAAILVSGILYAFAGNNTASTDGTTITAEADAIYSIPELMERDKNLSYDEFLKIREKYTQLSADYTSDPSNFETLIKLSEIFIFEARVTGEHPYYYGAALTTLDELLRNEKALTPDQHFNALFYKATVQLRSTVSTKRSLPVKKRSR